MVDVMQRFLDLHAERSTHWTERRQGAARSFRFGIEPPAFELGLCGTAALFLRVSVRRRHFQFVGADGFAGGARCSNRPAVNPDDAMAQAANLIHLMSDEDNGAAGAGDIAHFAETFFLEVYVADSQDFVDEKDFGFEVGSNSEGEADVHTAG